jgi:hypothetical protein
VSCAFEARRNGEGLCPSTPAGDQSDDEEGRILREVGGRGQADDRPVLPDEDDYPPQVGQHPQRERVAEDRKHGNFDRRVRASFARQQVMATLGIHCLA